MTKFKNRKGLALGSIFALIVSAFVGVAPAKAAVGDLIVTPAYGPATNFTAVAGSGYGIVLNTQLANGVAATGSLSYKVRILTADVTNSAVTYTGKSANSATATVPTGALYVTSESPWGDSSDAAYASIKVLETADSLSPTATGYNLLTLTADKTVTTSFQVEVTAWLDRIANDMIDISEAVSAPVTVTFVPGDVIAIDASITAPRLGDSTISGTLAFGSINHENYFQIRSSDRPKVGVGLDALATSNGTASSSSATVTYNSTLDRFAWAIDVDNIDQSASSTVSADVYYSYVFWDGNIPHVFGGEFANNSSSTISESFTVVAATLETFSPAVVTSTTVGQDTGLIGANTVTALEGTKTLSFKFAGYTDASTKSVAIGQGVVARVTLTDVAGSLDETTLTDPDGDTLTSTGVNSITFDVTSDINGEWSFDVTADEGNAGESFQMSVNAQGLTSQTLTVNWEEEAISLFQGPNKSAMKIANNGSISVGYSIVNQWGQVPTGDYQLEVTRARSSGTRTTALGTSADWSYDVPIEANGTATVAITDNGSATVEGVDTVTVTLQKKATAGGAYVDVSGTSANTFTLTYETDLKTAVLETTVNNNGAKRGTTTVKALALEAETLRNYDSRVDDVDALEFAASNAYTSATATTATELVAISGYVKTAAGVGITGVPVVISGSGLMFSDGASGTSTAVRHSLDSMVLTTGTGGAYTFYVRGNLSGTKTVTVAAAGKSNNVSLTFAAGSTAAANMAITAPATSDAGKVIDVVVKITDAYGNPASGVGVTFKSKGSGYLNALSGTSDADGEVVVKLITLTNDSGTATITATATLAGVSTAKVATVTIGAAAASADQKVNAGSFKGYVALYAKGYEGQRMSAKVGKDWVVVESLASDFERVVEFTGAGYTISVPIYIDRVLVDTIVVTTK